MSGSGLCSDRRNTRRRRPIFGHWEFDLGEWRLWLAVVVDTVAFGAIGAIWLAVQALVGGHASINDLVEEAYNNSESRGVEGRANVTTTECQEAAENNEDS